MNARKMIGKQNHLDELMKTFKTAIDLSVLVSV